MSNLSIYKASAGSGKTYQLTWIYLKMLFSDPSSYRQILAVTFTNKAAGEMKSRILESLWLLGKGDSVVSGYQQDLQKLFSLNSDEVKVKAHSILIRILNDYSSFFVGTIDRFFQWVIRGFVREIGLQTGYNLELNNDKILHEAVDLLMFKMDEDEELKDWLFMFAGDRIIEGKSWNLQKEIFNLGKEIFREGYQLLAAVVPASADLRKEVNIYKKELQESISRYENTLKSMSNKALQIISAEGLAIEDFSNKYSGPAGHFVKVASNTGIKLDPGKRAIDAAENIDAWAAKSCANRSQVIHVAGSLQPILRDVINYQLDHEKEYFAARCLLRNIYVFGILNDISLQIKEIAHDKNIFLLSDASVFLKKIIEDNEAPFIYEKAGNYFSMFMLDEFQDTSRFQWGNFLPLIKNGLGQGFSSMVVGDVKQSIYRWRNSDWKILASEIENDLSIYSPETRPLETNWRSYSSIVEFNNSFFSRAKIFIKDLIHSDILGAGADESIASRWQKLVERVYSGNNQKIPDKFKDKAGLVEHTFSTVKNQDEYLEVLKQKLPELIRDLQDRGYQARDIAILVRKGSEGKKIASILLEEGLTTENKYNFSLISNDSLFLNSNSAILFVISVLKHLNNPDDKLNTGFLRTEFVNYLIAESPEIDDFHELFTGEVRSGIAWPFFQNFEKKADHLKKLPLYEMTEEIIEIFGLNELPDNLPFIQAFQDVILDFIRDESNDIYGFLNYWEQNSASQTLNISETQDAIRIITIHKSKGLQFEVVIIPFCNWSVAPSSMGNIPNYIWCNTGSGPFNRIPYMPVTYGKEMSRSFFAEEYFSEKFHTYIDNINLMYVAFTRARKELHIFSSLEGKKDGLEKAGELAVALYTTQDQECSPKVGVRLQDSYSQDAGVFCLGKREMKIEKENSDANYYLESYPINLSKDKLGLNIKNASLSRLEEDIGQSLGYGMIMHEIFSYIDSVDDVKPAVEKLKRKGMIDERQSKALIGKIEAKIRNSNALEWFTNKYQLMKERELINDDAEILRPDRVMLSDSEIIVVDYKFGQKTSHIHEKQVRNYCLALESIEERRARGYLWYVDMDILKEVIH